MLPCFTNVLPCFTNVLCCFTNVPCCFTNVFAIYKWINNICNICKSSILCVNSQIAFVITFSATSFWDKRNAFLIEFSQTISLFPCLLVTCKLAFKFVCYDLQMSFQDLQMQVYDSQMFLIHSQMSQCFWQMSLFDSQMYFPNS